MPRPNRNRCAGGAKQLGMVPNLFRVVANSPAAPEGYLGLSGALTKGSLPAATRERIALAVVEVNGCRYCLSAHSYLGENIANWTRRKSSPTAMAPRMTPKPLPPWPLPSP